MEDKRFDKELKQLLKRLEQLLYNNYLAALNIMQVRNSLPGNKPFWFSGNYSANKAMDKIIADFGKQANSLLLNGLERSWKLGEENAIDKIQLAISKNARQRKAFDTIRTDAAQQQRNQGSKASALRFAEEKRGGANLSERVWNIGNGMKKEIETIIQNGMKEGKSADELSKMLKQHLNNPEASFKRVRNKETGELELSEAARKYKPGQGVYRSAKANAMRLARTEIAAAYRRAAWEKFQSDPMVKGIRIELSNNHTCKNPKTGKPEPFYDICDELAGIYPKTFLWTGWHPQCRCQMFPILINDTELRKLTDAQVKGEKYEPKQVKKPPKAFNEWLERNRERAKGWENMPYWVRDNKNFTTGTFEVNRYSTEEYTFTRARKTALAMNRAVEELNKMYPNLENTELAAIYHYTKSGGNYRQLNKQLFNNSLTDFSRASSVLISKGLKQLPKVVGPVYRGSIMKRKDFEAIYGSGDVLHKIFTSASQSVGSAIDFAAYRKLKKTEVQVIFIINSRNGRDISKISEFNGKFAQSDQQEVLFDKNTNFIITKQETDKNSTIWLEMTER